MTTKLPKCPSRKCDLTDIGVKQYARMKLTNTQELGFITPTGGTATVIDTYTCTVCGQTKKLSRTAPINKPKTVNIVAVLLAITAVIHFMLFTAHAAKSGYAASWAWLIIPIIVAVIAVWVQAKHNQNHDTQK